MIVTELGQTVKDVRLSAPYRRHTVDQLYLLDALIDFGVTQSGTPFVSLVDEKGGMSYLFTLEGDQ
jgi:hypothetical protein